MTVEGYVEAKYVYRRNNIYYYCRWIPADIKPYYSKQKIVHTLKTKSHKRALVMAKSINAKIEDYWLGIRLKNYDIETSISIDYSEKHDTPTLLECLEHYLKIKGKNKPKSFENTPKRVVRYFIDNAKNRPISSYTSKDAINFRDMLVSRDLSHASVKRLLATLKAIVNFSIKELSLDIKNHFSGIYLSKDSKVSKRPSIANELIYKIQLECKTIDDDISWMLGLISDSGMRLAEAAGLKLSDINLDDEIPHIKLIPHKHRPLKTLSSQRLIPLVGTSLWAAKQAVKNSTTEFLFPRYTDSNSCRSSSASASTNKLLKAIIGDEYVIHCFRHSLRDRLRNNNTPTEMIDQIGGWSMQSVGQTYGEGFNLENLHKQMKLIEIRNADWTRAV
jgi:integrase